MPKILFAVILSVMSLGVCYAQHAAGDKLELYINFESRKWDIPEQDSVAIVEVVNLLRGNPGMKILVEGHTDNGGDPAKNLALSEERARSVMKAIVARGIAAGRVACKGWGDTKPLTDNNSEDAKARNRRVEIIVQ